MAEAIFVRPIDWVAEVERLHDAGAKWIIDLGPSDTVTRLTAPVIRGLGVGIVPAATRAGQRNLFTVGAAPEVAPAWSSYAPSAVTLPDGSVKLSTKFTRLTGRSPILLAGMTPTTVDAKIVAAAANAGHWAELAGGGQVTEEIFDGRIAELTSCSSRAAPSSSTRCSSTRTCGSCRWAESGWCRRPVSPVRRSTASCVSAGIPELEEAVELIEELNSVGISHVVFKPGTVEQIKSVIKIAAEVPDKDVIVHIEGGRAGGHHSWEDLDDLLLATYAELRKLPNITICVGGGIGTPERAAEYLSGRWAEAYGFPAMPVDGILVGTAAMATLESTTSPAVKQMLVETTGTDHWISAGKAQGGMASSRSQLGADIHEIDNAASRCGRLLDEVAGDADAVAERRDEIIAAMADTAKPYFGDVGDMTYLQWLQRYVELAIGDGDSTADTASPGQPVAGRHLARPVRRDAQARRGPAAPAGLRPDRDAVRRQRRRPSAAGESGPGDRRRCWRATRTPRRSSCIRPTCRSSSRCARRWASRSTSCPSSTRTCGAGGAATRCGRPTTRATPPTRSASSRARSRSPASPASTSRSVSCWTASSRRRSTRCWRRVREPTPVVSRRQARADVTGPLAVVLDSPDVLWAGRTAINPVHRIGAPDEWQVNENRSATHPSTGARLELSGRWRVTLSVPLSRHLDRHPLHAAVVHGRRRHAGRHRRGRVDRDALGAGDRRRRRRPRRAAAGARQHRQVTVDWDPEEVADHTGVTATFGAPLAPGPDPGARRAGRAAAGPRCSPPSVRPSPTTASPSWRVC